ncbi:Ecto-NOX disulfide-thiol exchanger 1 like protein [Argiope bruennichi]|uniref:Ecto-NOX disulfide-thiol exchanger 1 like protein n=1 Tax=Argiope bruennichi TaxID=94029 RepID=A0A8T0F745_ARGBR|nr:Ecto-NOX disulfide-thiol exchanger 1 like protein [Argiope bruennichi]
MEENKNSDFKSKINLGENSNSRLGQSNSNLRPGSSNSNPRPGSSSSIPRPGSSSSNPRPSLSSSNPRPPSSSSHWQEKDRKPPKKRSHSENDDWGRENKITKRETPDKVKKEGNSELEETEKPIENPSDVPLMNLQDIALASQRLAVASMSQQPQQQMAVAMPQQSQQQIMHQQAIPYQSFGYNTSENYHVDPNQGAYALNPFPSMMPINSQWPVSNAMAATASSVVSTSGMGISSGMEMASPANGTMTAYPYMNMGNSDASLYGMVPTMPGIPVYAPYAVVNNIDTIVPMFNNLEPITIPNAVLTPPLPGERRSRRQKPPGCRTVFVGNLPEKITEEIIRDAFKICGPISVIRMSKKNFCHIRFANMESVDQALLLSGFRIRIDESEDPTCNGRLHVDYAVARDDQHDYECLERARLREERHRQQDAFRPPSPPPIPHFSEHEAQTLADRLRNEETFREGLQVLITWLDRGECNKKNSGSFYSLIQSSHSHVKRLRNEKSRCEEEAEKAKENLMNKNRSIQLEINEIEKVFVAAKTQKVWDHFTRSQRKKMEEMKNDTYDLKKTNSEDLVVERVEEEMELSDTEDKNENGVNQRADAAVDSNALLEKCSNLTEELDALSHAYEDMKGTCSEQHEEIVRLKYELEEYKKEKARTDSPISFDDQLSLSDNATQYSPRRVDVSENDIHLASLISIFLHVHPFGASIDYICSYLVKIFPAVNARDIESLLRRYPNQFKEVCTGIGATLEKKWTYIGFRFQ